jgi:hypothetical protein
MDLGALLGNRKSKGDTALADRLPIVAITVKGSVFISGLYWQKLDKVNRFMAEARKRAKQPDMAGMAIVAIRESDISVQAGFAPQKAGATKGAYSMAAAIAGRLGNNFVAAIPLADGADRYVFVACHKGAILQGADLVLPQEEAEQQLQKYLSRIRLASSASSKESDGEKGQVGIYAPSSFGLDGSEEISLEQLLQSKALRRDYRLKQLAFGGLSPKEVRTLGIACVLVGGLGYGGMLGYRAWETKNKNADNARAVLEAIADAKRRAGIQQGTTQTSMPTLPHPWLRSPPIVVFLRMCDAQYQKVPLVIQGWDLKKLECGLGHLGAWYVRDDNSFATLSAFRNDVNRRFGIEPDPDIQDSGNTASFHAGFKAPDFEVADAAAPAETAAVWDMISYFQQHAGGVTLSKQPLPAALASTSALPGQKAPPTPIQDWTTYTWEVSNADKAADFILSDFSFPTARLTSVSFERNPSGDQVAFSFKGELYVH